MTNSITRVATGLSEDVSEECSDTVDQLEVQAQRNADDAEVSIL